MAALNVRVERITSPTSKTASPSNPPQPPHHVIPAPSLLSKATSSSGWASYLPSWDPSPAETRPAATKREVAGFRNPWPSWRKPTRTEVWDSMQWGEDEDPCIALATSHLSDMPAPPSPQDKTKLPRFSDIDDWPNSTGAKAARLLSIQDPDFSFTTPAQSTPKAKATWLGHAGVLVQLLPLAPSSRPIRCLFDPIFSMRCSPSQAAGPIRSYPPPCEVRDLPPIDAVMISHNHYDHLDFDTIKSIWEHHSSTVHFFVPLNNRPWFVTCGIPLDRVTELDWWESAHLTSPNTPTTTTASLKIWCTPAQHSSGRSGNDANCTLWSSWYLEHLPSASKPYRVFFAGDTGYQFHGSPSWPPAPPTSKPNNPNPNKDMKDKDDDNNKTSPPCPAFAEIRTRLGTPHLLLLPVAVGATYAYLRSLVPLPDWISPVPRHSPGLAAATHMPPWDAARVLNVMAGKESTVEGRDEEEEEKEEGAVAIAMHWGTFVTEPVGVLKTLGELEWACAAQGVRFARSLEGLDGDEDGMSGSGRELCFLAVNHGESVSL
ncbi:beta-lactamase superfamily domain-containing protein [Cercophora scortea]|uniref:Beta-lactamase superfamily domain-containing protein n=1 Tax=Cercophora scortea TaxID=314031 RepID=A0AAE0IXC1_9PEZI|nr:beta-lactamase superfamily domain-containing protein [Cercophora scortea]